MGKDAQDCMQTTVNELQATRRANLERPGVDGPYGHAADSSGGDGAALLVAKLTTAVSSLEEKVESLAQNVDTLLASGSSSSSPDVKRLQVVITAAGSRFDRQLQELRQQMRSLHKDCAAPGERWPGRVLTNPCPDASDAASDAGFSEGGCSTARSLGRSSLGGTSLAFSAGSIDASDAAELKKVRAVVGAAGTVFSRELRGVRTQIRELREELQLNSSATSAVRRRVQHLEHKFAGHHAASAA